MKFKLPADHEEVSFFFFNDTATTEIYTLSLHDALPISPWIWLTTLSRRRSYIWGGKRSSDRKSTRLNSSHGYISYAVFCLKKKKKSHRCREVECAICRSAHLSYPICIALHDLSG